MALQIGITGGIGSGKSIVCRIFEALGAPFYSADERAKWLLNNDEKLKKAVEALLGQNAYLPDGSYNRRWVAQEVFSTPTLLHQLNAIVHPRVGEDTESWLKKHKKSPYVIKEAAIMARAGQRNLLDKVVVVQAAVELRIARVLSRDPQRSEPEIRDIISRQICDSERLKLADFVVINDETQLLLPQVWHLHQLFSKKQ